MTVGVRDAHAADADAIATAHVAGWQVAYRGIVPDDHLDDPEFGTRRQAVWRRQLGEPVPAAADSGECVVVGLLDDAVVGFGYVGPERDPDDPSTRRGEVYGFYVHPDAWGAGVADAMMQTCVERLTTRFDAAVLWVLAENPRARRFDERAGWELRRRPDGSPVEGRFTGPTSGGLAALPTPLVELQYVIALRAGAA